LESRSVPSMATDLGAFDPTVHATFASVPTSRKAARKKTSRTKSPKTSFARIRRPTNESTELKRLFNISHCRTRRRYSLLEWHSPLKILCCDTQMRKGKDFARCFSFLGRFEAGFQGRLLSAPYRWVPVNCQSFPTATIANGSNATVRTVQGNWLALTSPSRVPQNPAPSAQHSSKCVSKNTSWASCSK